MSDITKINDNLIVYNFEQGTQEWFEAKRGVPTASEASEILGSNTVYKKYLIKKEAQKNMIRYEPPKSYNSAKRGIEYEPFAIQAFEEKELVETINVGFIYNKKLKCGCSPDSIIKLPNNKFAGVEVKCFEYINHFDRIKNGISPKVMAQIQFSLMTTNFEYWYSVYYHPDFKKGKDLVIKIVKKDEKFVKGLKMLTMDVNNKIGN